MSTTHRLVVVRHAQAVPYARSDAERPLTDEGRADAAAGGHWLAAQGVVADSALVSSAIRARQTWTALADRAGWSLLPQVEQAMYAADEDGALDLVTMTAEEVGTLVVVGHNPTVGMLAQLLDDGDGPAESVGQLVQGYPTCAVTVFDVPGPWTDLAPGGARLALFTVARAGS